jgi:hypothetical protein
MPSAITVMTSKANFGNVSRIDTQTGKLLKFCGKQTMGIYLLLLCNTVAGMRQNLQKTIRLVSAAIANV